MENLPSWDLTQDFSEMARRYHTLPPPDQPQQWIGRADAEEEIRLVASNNFGQRTSTDHADFAFLVASGHVRSGKTRSGYETPRIVGHLCSQTADTTFSDVTYLRVDFLNGSKFNQSFDLPGLSASEALGARLMNAFYRDDTSTLRRVKHNQALAHIINSVRANNRETVVPIVVHFDEHGAFIQERNVALGNKLGKNYFLDMLSLIGSAATSSESAVSSLHAAGHFFIVPITTGTSHSAANFDAVSRYQIRKVPLKLLDQENMLDMATACLLPSDEETIEGILNQPLFRIALGDTGGLPGLIVYACRKGDALSYVQSLHYRIGGYVTSSWSGRWAATTSVYLARPEVTDDTVLEEGYTMKDALDGGTVFYRNERELGLAPALLAKFNETQSVFNPVLVKTISKAEEWTWQDFEKAHLLFLAATMKALIKEQGRFGNITLAALLRNVHPVDSPALRQPLSLPDDFVGADYTQENRQCIPKSNADQSRELSLDTKDINCVHLAAAGTPILDGYMNLRLNNLHGATTLFVQYKHSGLESSASPVSVSTMNNETSKLRNRLMKHGWPNDKRFLFLWVTNRAVTNDEGAAPDKDLFWVDKDTLCEHAPLLGYRGLVPEESSRNPLGN